ncbi:MAG TPA: phosphoribosyltransferase family protein [Ornithinibacter sp.]|nr:phosphoribosyltransferase family protein [Ornithinibacter sp.]
MRAALVAAVDLVLPAGCAVCGDAGGPLCRPCRGDLRASALPGGAALVTPAPPPPGMPHCWAAARFEGALRSAITAYKDEDRRDLRPLLAQALALGLSTALATDPTLRLAVASGERVLVVPLPTSLDSRRRRGDDPVADLARAAVDHLRGADAVPLAVAPVLAHVRAVADQARLGRVARRANLAGAIDVTPGGRDAVRGSACVLADDVVTTGATLTEAARALRAHGAPHVVAVAVAATPRRSRGSRDTASDPALVGHSIPD